MIRGLLAPLAFLRRLLDKEKALYPPAASDRVFLFPSSYKSKLLTSLKTKNPGAFAPGLFLCSGGRIRTSDLWVMSPTSYHCSTPHYIFISKNLPNELSRSLGTPPRNIYSFQKICPTSYPDPSGLHPALYIHFKKSAQRAIPIPRDSTPHYNSIFKKLLVAFIRGAKVKQ